MDVTPSQRRILEEIGFNGLPPEKLRDGRESQVLERHDLIVFWPLGRERPSSIYGAATVPGRWYLTAAGADAIGFGGPLRLA